MVGTIISVILGILIFGYAVWSIACFIKKSRQGRCAACSLKNACGQSDCCAERDNRTSREQPIAFQNFKRS